MGKTMFQSSLELSPECNVGKLSVFGDPLLVSILTRAFARVQHIHVGFGSRPHPNVSILTRAFARVQRSRAVSAGTGLSSFQSSLELSPECNVHELLKGKNPLRFQSSLELSPECNKR